MTSLDPQPAQESQSDADLAGLLRRACALALDLGLAGLLGLSVTAAARALGIAQWVGDWPVGHWFLEHQDLAWSAVYVLPAWLALSVIESMPAHASPGKRALGLRLVGPRPGQPLSFVRIALRTAIKLAPWHIGALALLFPEPFDPRNELELARLLILLGSNLWIGIYLAIAAITRRRQSLHDLIVGTQVVNARFTRAGHS